MKLVLRTTTYSVAFFRLKYLGSFSLKIAEQLSHLGKIQLNYKLYAHLNICGFINFKKFFKNFRHTWNVYSLKNRQ